MRAGVAQGKGLASFVAADGQRLFQQHRFREFSAPHLVRRERAIPEPEEHQRIGRLRLEWRFVSHGNR